MITVEGVVALDPVADDLCAGKDFYDQIEQGVGDFFWDSLMADVRSLKIYAGIHVQEKGLHRMPATRFPYLLYYLIDDHTVYVVAILPMRKDPLWVQETLTARQP
ncbi:MAG: type II toxin-antitoxin system RelE/ParE family toxin [Desulfuromonadales bacterium]|nr:type II toxin-antitoxin system RelE/ParE family toxin [Desulfuromonadales bacterium]